MATVVLVRGIAHLTPMKGSHEDLDRLPPLQRRLIVEQARANLRARGLVPHPLIQALYEQYIAGTRTRQQIHAELAQHRSPPAAETRALPAPEEKPLPRERQ